MKTSEDYVESLRGMRPNVRMGGEIVPRDDPRIVPGVNVMRITYDAATDPELQDLFTTTCPDTGKKISRFCALCRSGFPVTMPFEEDYFDPTTRPWLEKYTVRNPKVSAEKIHRLQRTISDYPASAWAGVWQVAAVHGGGSPAMETVAIGSNYDFNERKNIVKRLAGIED